MMLIKDIKFRRIRNLARKRVSNYYYSYKCSLDSDDGDKGFLESSFDWYKFARRLSILEIYKRRCLRRGMRTNTESIQTDKKRI